MSNTGLNRITRPFGLATATGVGVALCAALLGRNGGGLQAPPVDSVIVPFVLVLFATWLARVHGVHWLWGALLLLWMMPIVDTLVSNGVSAAMIVTMLPEWFSRWSFLAIPCFVSLVLVASQEGRHGRLRIPVAGTLMLGWTALALWTAWLAQYAPDVGGTPRNAYFARLVLLFLAAPAPVALCALAIYHSRFARGLEERPHRRSEG